MLTRRAAFLGLIAAPAVIRVADLMSIKAFASPQPFTLVISHVSVLDDPELMAALGKMARALAKATHSDMAKYADVIVPAPGFSVGQTIRLG